MRGNAVRVVEVGVRDGLQSLPFVPTALKKEMITRLAQTNVSLLDVTGFVSPKWTPQFADSAEIAEFASGSGIPFTCIVPNLKEKWDDAVELCTEAVAILEPLASDASSCSHDDRVFYAAALSNLGSYMSFQEKSEEALPRFMDSLRVFEKELGRTNEYTVSALTNALKIMKALDMKEEFEELQEEFSEVKVELDPTDVDEAEEAAMAEKWEAEGGKKSFDPPGFVKDKDYSLKEMQEFVEKWKDSGMVQNEDFKKAIEDQLEFTKNAAAKNDGEVRDMMEQMGLSEKEASAIKEMAGRHSEELSMEEIAENEGGNKESVFAKEEFEKEFEEKFGEKHT